MTIGILLTNTGTPEAPNRAAVRAYLREFLSDRRIVQIPRAVWLPILYGFILTTRPTRSAKLYQKIWTPLGSPLRVIMGDLVNKLNEQLRQHENDFYVVDGMNYGKPSIPTALNTLQQNKIQKLLMLPLFPQYSYTTTASSVDRLQQAGPLIKNQIINAYGTNPHYIQALAETVKQQWQKQGRQAFLMISFHGIPERFVSDGDPYQQQCQQTANLLAQALQLKNTDWILSYQSQFGYAKWLKPSTQKLFEELPKQEKKYINVICPGFAVDCLETLEEIEIRGKESFIAAGGETLNYIPALNATDMHVRLLCGLIEESLSGR